MRTLLRIRAALALAVLAMAASACAVSTNDEPVAVRGAFDRIQETSTTTTTTTTPPEGGTREVDVFFVESRESATTLTSVKRPVQAGAGVRDVLDHLFQGQPPERRLRNDVPSGAVLLEANLLPDTARLVVNTQGLFGQTGVQNPILRNALGQIVCTATALAAVDSVQFQNEGRSVSASIEDSGTVDRPVDCTDYDAL